MSLRRTDVDEWRDDRDFGRHPVLDANSLLGAFPIITSIFSAAQCSVSF
jgi:hypothetical protein